MEIGVQDCMLKYKSVQEYMNFSVCIFDWSPAATVKSADNINE